MMRKVLHGHGYQEIRFPIVEKTELFDRLIGKVTDIVEKEMYTFLDRNEERLSLRPEGTASCVRAGIEHGLLLQSNPTLMVHEVLIFVTNAHKKVELVNSTNAPAEVFGLAGPDIDAEIILMSAAIMEKLGIKSFVTLQLDSIRYTPDSR